MPKVKMVTLTAAERAAVEKASKYGSTPSFRLRCQAILLKSGEAQRRTSSDVAEQLGGCEMSVNDWLKRYQAHGLAGLKVQKGRGRKAILQADTDLAAVRRAVRGSRQRLPLAKAELEQELGRQFGLLALRRFLKKAVAVTNEYDAKESGRLTRMSTRSSARLWPSLKPWRSRGRLTCCTAMRAAPLCCRASLMAGRLPMSRS